MPLILVSMNDSWVAHWLASLEPWHTVYLQAAPLPALKAWKDVKFQPVTAHKIMDFGDIKLTTFGLKPSLKDVYREWYCTQAQCKNKKDK